MYASYSDVNLLTNLTSLDVADADITSIIAQSTLELNRLINVREVRERIDYIDNTRENKIDGSNKTYYVRNWKGKFLADMNNDGSVSASDIKVYAVTSQGVETAATVSSIDAELGKFVLQTAYSNDYKLYVTYEWCYRNPATPDPLIKLACTLLTSAYCYAKINIGMAPQASFGNVKIYRHFESFDYYYKRFLQIVSQINQEMPDYIESCETV